MKASYVAEYERLDRTLESVTGALRCTMAPVFAGYRDKELSPTDPQVLRRIRTVLEAYNRGRPFRLQLRGEQARTITVMMEYQRKLLRRMDQLKGDKN